MMDMLSRNASSPPVALSLSYAHDARAAGLVNGAARSFLPAVVPCWPFPSGDTPFIGPGLFLA